MASPLTPSVRLQTNAPFPVIQKGAKDGELVVVSDPKAKIVIESSAEYMQYDIPGSKYQSSSNFFLLHDSEGQPLILSIGTDRVSRKAETMEPLLANNICHSDCTSVPTSMVEQGVGRRLISAPAQILKLRSVMPATVQTIRDSSSLSAATMLQTSPRPCCTT
jgi:hypothetical protein